MQTFGLTFEHNRQSIRILTCLEKKYANHAGLNLTFDLLNGLTKHQSLFDQAELKISDYPSLEAQLVNLADEIAYTNHDLDDGLRANLLQRTDLTELKLWQTAQAAVTKKLSGEAWNHRVVSNLINLLVTDLLRTTNQNLKKFKITSLAEVKKISQPLVEFSKETRQALDSVHRFLKNNFYANPLIQRRAQRGLDLISKIFRHLMAHPELLPPNAYFKDYCLAQVVADFVAGMTDSYAAKIADSFSLRTKIFLFD